MYTDYRLNAFIGQRVLSRQTALTHFSLVFPKKLQYFKDSMSGY